MLDHVTLNVSDLARSKDFYTQALRPLGYSLGLEWEQGVGFNNPDGKADLWIAQRGEPSAPVHVALVTSDRASVDAFYEAALAAGGQDNGPPGLRPHYHEHYYGAFVHDPDGINLEAVCHRPEETPSG
jgi:catechol 2,3-dioxygenase-like lactoylglutathione lyase family enzyme